MSNVHTSQATKLFASLILALGLVLGLTSRASAHTEKGESAEHAHGQIVLRPERGKGSVELAPDGSGFTGAIDAYIVDGAVNFVAEGTLKAGTKLRTLQTGRVQNYVYGLLGGVAFFSIIQYFLK